MKPKARIKLRPWILPLLLLSASCRTQQPAPQTQSDVDPRVLRSTNVDLVGPEWIPDTHAERYNVHVRLAREAGDEALAKVVTVRLQSQDVRVPAEVKVLAASEDPAIAYSGASSFNIERTSASAANRPRIDVTVARVEDVR